MFVPIKTKDGERLMPMHPARVRKLIKRREATPYFDNGIYGLIKNTLVKHIKQGLTRISGFGKKGIALYSLEGKRLCQNAKAQDFKVLTRLNFNYWSGVSSPR